MRVRIARSGKSFEGETAADVLRGMMEDSIMFEGSTLEEFVPFLRDVVRRYGAAVTDLESVGGVKPAIGLRCEHLVRELERTGVAEVTR